MDKAPDHYTPDEIREQLGNLKDDVPFTFMEMQASFNDKTMSIVSDLIESVDASKGFHFIWFIWLIVLTLIILL